MENLDLSGDESIKRVLESAYGQTSPPSKYKVKLLQDLKNSVNVLEATPPLWKLTDWAIISAVIILAIIAYGVWLPQHVIT